MRRIQPDRCYQIRYPTGSTVEFRTQHELPIAYHLIRVKLVSKRIINLMELLMEPWDEFAEIECPEELDGHRAAFW